MQQLAEPGDAMLVAIYDTDGRIVSVVTVSSSAELAELYDTEPGMTYQMMLMDGDNRAPLCQSESNSLS